ncbi:hypothetical protein PXH59_03405 [Xenorhabdus sp. SF857]|uniref:hypothetical protein n=1 Tax=Xenorhabdus bakwenae TaxID=3026967 RepID=UPI002557D466|nr:hypothetical protein [Xenorhabdus sp. SF857]WFQ80227.1 hypothetical protein PXH59_03405 [Xenorhabdus sp. SF857]
MHPITLSYTYAETTSRTLHGRTQVIFKDPADLHIDMTFSEFAKRSNPEPGEMLAYLMTHCDEEQIAEELKKAGYGYRHLMAIAQHMHKEAA